MTTKALLKNMRKENKRTVIAMLNAVHADTGEDEPWRYIMWGVDDQRKVTGLHLDQCVGSLQISSTQSWFSTPRWFQTLVFQACS